MRSSSHMLEEQPKASSDELKAFVDAAISLEKCANIARNRDKWRQRFLHEDPRCERVFAYMLICEEQRQEKVLLRYQTEHKALVYACTCIYTGSTYEQMATMDFVRGLGQFVPSQSSYYRMIKRVTIAVHACTERSMQEARDQIDSMRFVSFDSAWVHRRKSRQCFGGVIDITTGKVIGYAIAVIKMQLDEVYPCRTCESCDSTKEAGRQRTVVENAPKILILQICRNISTFVTEKEVGLNGSIYIPVIRDDEESYAEYRLCSIVCFTGTDENGHYFTYNITDDGIVLVNDREIRIADPSDVAIMTTHSAFLFYIYCQSVEAKEYPERNNIWIDDMINQLSTGSRIDEVAHPPMIDQDDILNVADDEIEAHRFKTNPHFAKCTGNIICVRK